MKKNISFTKKGACGMLTAQKHNFSRKRAPAATWTRKNTVKQKKIKKAPAATWTRKKIQFFKNKNKKAPAATWTHNTM